ncbi:MAG: stalk domain-containing protein [Syntrophomonadaceae bacterium]
MIGKKPAMLIVIVMTLALLFGPAVPLAQADTLFNLSAPTSLQATSTFNSVTLTWNDTSTFETGFNIERKGPGDSDFKQIGTVSYNKETYTDTGLTSGTQYSYRVYAYNDWDNSSYSNTVLIKTDTLQIVIPPLLGFPSAPSGLTAEPAFITVSLEWEDKSSNESSFIIERLDPGDASYHQTGTVGANVTSFTDGGLSADTQYSYRVKAHNAIGDSGYSNVVAVKTLKVEIIWPILTAPAAPSNLAADSVSKNGVALKWSDNSNNESGFRIERSTGGSAYSEIATVGADGESYTDSAVTPGNTYDYRVRAYNSFGNSAYTNPLAVTIPQSGTTPGTILVYKINQPTYTWNGIPQAMDVAPMIRESRTLLPIRYVADPLGAQTMWNSLERKVTIMTAAKTIELWVDNNTARINGVAVLIDPANPNVMPVVIPPGRTMMPLSFIANNLDCDVVWNSGDSSVTVTFPKS